MIEKTEIGAHICRENEYKQFHPIEHPYEMQFKTLKNNGKFYCMDDTDISGEELDWSVYTNDDISRDLMIHFNPDVHSNIDELELMVVMNQEKLDLDVWGTDVVNKKSVMQTITFPS